MLRIADNTRWFQKQEFVQVKTDGNCGLNSHWYNSYTHGQKLANHHHFFIEKSNKVSPPVTDINVEHSKTCLFVLLHIKQ